MSAQQPKIRYAAIIEANQVISQYGEANKFRRLVIVIHERAVGTTSRSFEHEEHVLLFIVLSSNVVRNLNFRKGHLI